MYYFKYFYILSFILLIILKIFLKNVIENGKLISVELYIDTLPLLTNSAAAIIISNTG